jgi:hypothetical protein
LLGEPLEDTVDPDDEPTSGWVPDNVGDDDDPLKKNNHIIKPTKFIRIKRLRIAVQEGPCERFLSGF